MEKVEPRLSVIFNGAEQDLTVREAILADVFSLLRMQGFEGYSDGDILPYFEKVFDACAKLHFPPSALIGWLAREFREDEKAGTFQPRKMYLGQKCTKYISHLEGMRRTA